MNDPSALRRAPRASRRGRIALVALAGLLGLQPRSALAQTDAPRGRPQPAAHTATSESATLRVALPEGGISSVQRLSAPELTGAEAPAPAPRRAIEWHPSLEFAQEYTDNFDFREHDAEPNWRSELTPRLALQLGNGPSTGSLDYRAELLEDSAGSGLRANHELAAEGLWRASPLAELRLSDGLIVTDDPGRADALGLRQERQRFRRNRFVVEGRYLHPRLAASLVYRQPSFADVDGATTLSQEFGVILHRALGRSNVLSFGYEQLSSHTEREGSESDVSGPRWTAALSRSLPRLGSTGIAATLTDQRERRAAGSDVQLWTVLPYVQLDRRRDVRASLAAGWSELRWSPGGTRRTFTAIGSIRLARGRWAVDLSAARGFSETFAEGEDFGIVETRIADAALSYRVAARAWLTLSRSSRENEFLALGSGFTGRTEERRDTRLALRIGLARGLEAALEFGTSELESPLSGRSFSARRVQATLRSSMD